MKLDVGQIFSFLKTALMGFGLWMVRQSGRDAAELEVAEEKLEAIDETNKIHDSVDSDPEYRDRLRDHFGG